MENIKIKDISIYHPENIVDNEYYINHFKSKGHDVTGLINALGRNKRFVSTNPEETSLTMAIEASRMVLEKAGVSPEELDLIVFTTQIPETSLPSNAIRVHKAIGGGSKVIAYDLNANCAGMVVAMDQVSFYMKANRHIQKALIIGSDLWSLITNPEDPLSYIGFADGAAAIILEKTAEENVGFIDSTYYADSTIAEKMMFPAEGLAKGMRETSELNRMITLPFDASIVIEPTFNMIDELLKRNNVSPKEAKYCFSQFSVSNINKIQEYFSLDDEQIIFIAEEFSYTGTSSPIFSLHEGVKQGRIKRGDHVVFWTLGHGFQLIATLIKY